MKYIKRISLIVVAVFVLACSVPLSSMAVDPVSAATMANAFAQAITAYGASQGVSMTFDVANTDGIGEGVHDLWDQYAADMAQSNVTVSDYSNLAASVFPTLWKKTFDYVTVSLDAATVGEIDGFWNWLLSGPAEMTKVDNEYYEWSLNQNNTVDPIPILNVVLTTFNNIPAGSLPANSTITYYFTDVSSNPTTYSYTVSNISNYPVLYYFIRYPSSNNIGSGYSYYFYCFAQSSSARVKVNNSTNFYINDTNNSYNYRVIYNASIQSVTSDVSGVSPIFDSSHYNSYEPYYIYGAKPADFDGAIDSSTDSISVRPYVGDTVPQNVYIPDNNDVNYTPVAADIPLDILWDDTLFGDGTGTLTDAQSEAITQAADDAITDNPDKTLEIADTSNPPTPSPSEVYIPFLPVTLPSFNFSLSGIWHYVTAWVASLGAWFTLVFTTWSYLPYAISVPVYATAVIVIVLGVYKRFFM